MTSIRMAIVAGLLVGWSCGGRSHPGDEAAVGADAAPATDAGTDAAADAADVDADVDVGGACAPIGDLLPSELCEREGWCWALPATGGYDFNDLWASATGTVWAAAGGGTLLRGDAVGWSRVPTGTQAALLDVWGTADDDVWIVGGGGTALHWNGVTLETTATGTDEDLTAVWAPDATRAWVLAHDAVGGMRVLAWDGRAWSSVAAPAGAYQPTGLWGTSSDDLWAVGYGFAMHWDGSAWSAPEVLPAALEDVGGSGPDDVWAVGCTFGERCSSTAAHWDGVAWTFESELARGRLRSVWVGAAGDVWSAGDPGIIHREGEVWSSQSSFGLRAIFRSCVSSGVLVAGQSGVIRSWDGVVWGELLGDRGFAIEQIWGSSPEDVWFVGADVASRSPRVVRWDGVRFIDLSDGLEENPSRVWGTGPEDVWIVAGLSTLEHWDGGEWSPTSLPDEPWILGLWGTADDDVWAVAYDRVLHFDGAEWSTLRQIDFWNLHDAWGSSTTDVWFVGPSDHVVHWNRGDFTDHEIDWNYIHAVWGSGPDDVWAVGEPSILHFDGATWSPTESESDIGCRFVDVHGTGPGDVWSVGSCGETWHWDGGSWSDPGELPTTPSAVWASAPDDVWVGGSGGILRRH